jgi:hypothetical protein
MHPLLEETRDLLAQPLAGSSPEQVALHPHGDAACWNAWQVVEHLSATWRATTQGLEDRAQKGRPLLTRPTMAQRVRQVAVCRLGYFPKGLKAPAMVKPSDGPPEPVSGDELIAQFSAALAAMDSLLTRMEAAAKGSAVLTHFVLGPLTVEGWRRFHRAHARHHSPQIARALQRE